MKRLGLTLVSLLLLYLSPLEAQRPSSTPTPESRAVRALRADAVWGPLRFLSDDLLEGRGTGTRGGDIAAQYIAAQFMALGLEPAGDSGTYFQRVPMVDLVPSATLQVGGPTARALRFRDDFVAWSERVDSVVTGSGELVFVGFGVSAPEWSWDDYKGVDVRGKILLMLVNDPGLRNPDVFRGNILTYYGRWTYKLEEAARRGALAVLMVHNDTMATYGWNTVKNSWTGDQVRLVTPPTSLVWAGWIQQPVIADILRSRGFDMDQLMRDAASRDFRPVATGITLTGDVHSVLRRMSSANVLGRLRGGDRALRDEVVMIGAHYDHLGIGQPVNGDSIMNGALDNASGVAAMLAIAEAFATSGVRPKRSLLFVSFTGEEKGLLGSTALAEQPLVPLARIAAILNMDVTNLYGATRDIAVQGGDQSSLGLTFQRAARAEGLRVTVDQNGLVRGAFFRSDHFPFARVGVPGLSFATGSDFVGRGPGWADSIRAEYTRNRYHQPADELLPWYTVEGTLQQARVLIRIAIAVANALQQPTWTTTSEFRAAGERRLKSH
jgi:Zn-dependent M28 family amino/carboxypeptidase